jgi:hypothetical protein
MKTAHAMDATSGRRRSATKEKSVPRRPIERSGGTEEKLPNVHRAAGEITADQIVVPVLKRGGRGDGTRDDALAEARSEPFDLSLDWLEAISTAAVRDVAIGPGRMPGN